MSRSEEFASGHGMARYVHSTDADLSPGDVVRPAADRGHRSRYANSPSYDPSRVYVTDTQHPEYNGKGSYGQHKYAVEPLGELHPDPEVEHQKQVYEQNPEKAIDHFGRPFQESDLGGALASRTVSAARVLRKLP